MTDHRPDYRIVEDDLWEPEIEELLALHLEEAERHSPPGKTHALSIERLREDDVTFYTAWDDEELAACGGLRQLDSTHGEIKAMRAAPAYRGKGAGRAILEHIIAEAKTRGYTRLSLETGKTAPFKPAVSLYVSHGFTPCEAFADHVLDDFSICLSKTL